MSVDQRCVTSVCFRWDSRLLDPLERRSPKVHHSSLTWWTSSRTSSFYSGLRSSPSSVRGPPVEFRTNDLTNMAWDCREITILVLSLLQQCGCYPIDWTTAGTFGSGLKRVARFCHTRGSRSTRVKFRSKTVNGIWGFECRWIAKIVSRYDGYTIFNLNAIFTQDVGRYV